MSLTLTPMLVPLPSSSHLQAPYCTPGRGLPQTCPVPGTGCPRVSLPLGLPAHRLLAPYTDYLRECPTQYWPSPWRSLAPWNARPSDCLPKAWPFPDSLVAGTVCPRTALAHGLPAHVLPAHGTACARVNLCQGHLSPLIACPWDCLIQDWPALWLPFTMACLTHDLSIPVSAYPMDCLPLGLPVRGMSEGCAVPGSPIPMAGLPHGLSAPWLAYPSGQPAPLLACLTDCPTHRQLALGPGNSQSQLLLTSGHKHTTSFGHSIKPTRLCVPPVTPPGETDIYWCIGCVIQSTATTTGK